MAKLVIFAYLRHNKVVDLFLCEYAVVHQDFQGEHCGNCELVALEESTPNVVEHRGRNCVNQYDTPAEWEGRERNTEIIVNRSS